MGTRVIDLRIGDQFLWPDPLGGADCILTVTEGPANHFGSVTLGVAEWDFDFEAPASHIVTVVSPTAG